MRLKLTTAGEPHGPRLTVILEGIPAGLRIDPAFVNGELSRRQHGHGRGGRMKIEKDEALFEAGVPGSRTLRSPLPIGLGNPHPANLRALLGAPVPAAAPPPAKRRVHPPPAPARPPP